MKVVENKSTTLVLKNIEDVPVFSKYSDLILIVINNPPQTGFSIADIKQRLQIAAAMENLTDNKFTLEDVDFTLVKTLLAAFKWTQVNKEIVEFSDYIDSIK